MSHRQHTETFSVHFPDDGGFIGRECPAADCLRYFKIIPRYGHSEPLTRRCPYCGHEDEPNRFWTDEQLAYLKSSAVREIQDILAKRFRGGWTGIRFEARRRPIPYYQEKQLETHVVCDRCDLRYAIYGVFGFCPDCGVHNSLQILNKNLDLAEKKIALAATVDAEMGEQLVGDALGNAVAAFDGFGREACRVHARNSAVVIQKNLSFQNLSGARTNVQAMFDFDLASGLTSEEWALACRCFKKRHLLAHKAGVVDDEYVRTANDPGAVVGRKVPLTPEQVKDVIAVLRKLGAALVVGMAGSP